MRSLILLLITMLVSFSMNARADEWCQLPIACTPDVAEKWEKGDAEPAFCHCPPQEEFCPNPANIAMEDVDFVVEVEEVGTAQVNATEVANLPKDMAGIYKLAEGNGDGLLKILAPKVDEKLATGSRVQDIIAGNRFNNAIILKIVLNGNEDALIDWLEGFDMPPEMVGQCCDGGLCPAGSVLEQEKKTIEVEVCRYVDVESNEDEDCIDPETLEEQPENEDDCPSCCKPREPERVCEKERREVTIYSCKLVKSFPREGCLIEGTSVMLKDGTEKAIETLNVGDEVMGDIGTVKVIAINKFRQEHDTVYGVNGGKAFFTQEHPVLTEKGWKSVKPAVTKTVSGIEVGPLVIGDVIITKKGEKITVKTIDKHPITNSATVYNLKVNGNGAFTANGMVVKGFNKVEIQY